jgi:hypothetical protein
MRFISIVFTTKFSYYLFAGSLRLINNFGILYVPCGYQIQLQQTCLDFVVVMKC